RPLVQIDALVLALVILKTERFPCTDAQDLSGILLGMREEDLLAPGLGHAGDAHLDTPSTGRASRGRIASTLRLASSSLASPESSPRASSAIKRASAALRARITCLMVGMAAGFMLSSVTPRPTRTTAAYGLAAISPHTETGRPRCAAASTIRRTSCRIPGCRGR